MIGLTIVLRSRHDFQMSINFTIRELKEELHINALTIVLRSRHDLPDVYKLYTKRIERRASHECTDNSIEA